MTLCQFVRKPFAKPVFQTAAGRFVLISGRRFTARIQCPDSSVTANIDYATTFDLGPGCSIDTGDHILNSDDHFDADEPTEVSTWNWSPLQALNYKLANPHVAEAFQDFSKQVVPEQTKHYLKTSFLPQGSPLQIIIFTTCAIVLLLQQSLLTVYGGLASPYGNLVSWVLLLAQTDTRHE